MTAPPDPPEWGDHVMGLEELRRTLVALANDGMLRFTITDLYHLIGRADPVLVNRLVEAGVLVRDEPRPHPAVEARTPSVPAPPWERFTVHPWVVGEAETEEWYAVVRDRLGPEAREVFDDMRAGLDRAAICTKRGCDPANLKQTIYRIRTEARALGGNVEEGGTKITPPPET
jgi:hypothetical protein